MVDLKEIAKKIVELDADEVEKLVKAAIRAKIPPEQILSDGLIAGMQVIGRQFKQGKIFLPEVLMAGEAMKAAMKLLKPLLTRPGGAQHFAGKAAIGTVQGDVHDIGKNIVVMMLQGHGWDITDLGVDVSPEDFCNAVKENDFSVIGLSALLTVTMPAQEQTIRALEASGLRSKVKVAIGGAPVTADYARRIGADGYARDATEAVELFSRLSQA